MYETNKNNKKMPVPLIKRRKIGVGVERISPGAVASVGDCLLTVKLKSTFPGEYRFENNGKMESRFGSNVSDGQKVGYTSAGGPARTFDTNWGGNRDSKTSVGWVTQDLRAVDRSFEEILGSTPHYSWRNRIANVHQQSRTGDLFKYRSGGLINAPTGPSRGNNPRIVASTGGEVNPMYDNVATGGYNQYTTDGKVDSGYYDRQRQESGLQVKTNPMFTLNPVPGTGSGMLNRGPMTGSYRQ